MAGDETQVAPVERDKAVTALEVLLRIRRKAVGRGIMGRGP